MQKRPVCKSGRSASVDDQQNWPFCKSGRSEKVVDLQNGSEQSLVMKMVGLMIRNDQNDKSDITLISF